MLNISDNIKLHGRVHIIVRNAETGKIKHEVDIPNLIVTVGRQAILDKLAEDTPSAAAANGFKYLWVGSGATAVDLGDTDLDSYESEKTISDHSRSGTTSSYETFYNTGSGNHEWEEVALATDAHGSGTMITRSVFTAGKFTKTGSDTVTCTWDISW